MRLFGKAVLCLCIAVSWNSAHAAAVALPVELDSDTVVDTAADFSDFFLRDGPAGLWERIQACYNNASKAGDTDHLLKCMMMDEAGKALDDNRVKAVGAVRNLRWYETGLFTDRMRKYSQTAFGNPNAYADFWDKNKKAFGTALRKLNVNGRMGVTE